MDGDSAEKMTARRVLVTGASGFVGQPLCQALASRGSLVRSATRRIPATEGLEHPRLAEQVPIGNITSTTDWTAALRDVTTVVHLAARVHVMHDRAADPLADFRAVNVEGTRALAEQAVRHGVRRLVFVSSIKVNGESTAVEGAEPSESVARSAFRESDDAQPQDPYAVSKWEAEQALREIAARSNLEVVIVRPPLVYGPHVKGNLLRLMQLIQRGVPLPFRGVRNQRSLISVWNLVDALVQCVKQPQAAGQTYLVSDGRDLSTEQLVRGLAAGLNKDPLLFSIPAGAGRFAARLVGKSAVWDRLFGSLVVDSSKIRRELNWQPPIAPEDGLLQTGQAFLADAQPKPTVPRFLG